MNMRDESSAEKPPPKNKKLSSNVADSGTAEPKFKCRSRPGPRPTMTATTALKKPPPVSEELGSIPKSAGEESEGEAPRVVSEKAPNMEGDESGSVQATPTTERITEPKDLDRMDPVLAIAAEFNRATGSSIWEAFHPTNTRRKSAVGDPQQADEDEDDPDDDRPAWQKRIDKADGIKRTKNGTPIINHGPIQ